MRPTRSLATQLEDAASSLEARMTDNGLVIEAMTKQPVEVVVAVPVLTDRQRTRLEAEQDAGRRAVLRHAEAQIHRPPPQKSEAELKAEGTSVPVFRPGDLREYTDTFSGTGQTKSKG